MAPQYKYTTHYIHLVGKQLRLQRPREDTAVLKIHSVQLNRMRMEAVAAVLYWITW